MSATIVARRPGMPRSLWLGLTLLILLVWSFSGLEIDGGRVAALPKTMARMFGLFFPPDVEYGRQSVVPAILESIQIAWFGTLVGAALSLPLGLLASANLFPRATRLVKPLLAAVRAVPELLLAIYFVPVVGLGAFAGTLAIGLHSIGTLGKLTADVVESMDQRPIEAVAASGGGALSVLRFAVLPQVLPEIVALWLFRFEISLRASAVLGVVGAGGIGGVLLNTLRYREFARAGAVVVLTVIVVLAIDAVSGSIRERLVRE
ncbi:MAG: phosphonate ABC transporter, permease protein PhnE [Acidobacteria bacterium]|nr:phosphonate ABC transporter, permease protein PhnE [Acidobacteriota bacterium]MCZ6727088.1 phosphonate ABC transporter, permease protein PhnE [Acidobacteriota bacterium]